MMTTDATTHALLDPDFRRLSPAAKLTLLLLPAASVDERGQLLSWNDLDELALAMFPEAHEADGGEELHLWHRGPLAPALAELWSAGFLEILGIGEEDCTAALGRLFWPQERRGGLL